VSTALPGKKKGSQRSLISFSEGGTQFPGYREGGGEREKKRSRSPSDRRKRERTSSLCRDQGEGTKRCRKGERELHEEGGEGGKTGLWG